MKNIFDSPDWYLLPALAGALLGWAIGGMFLISWMTDRNFARGRYGWEPSAWLLLVCGPAAWILGILRRILR
jgi:hypothetical protein